MTPKTKRRLKWVAAAFRTKEGYRISHLFGSWITTLAGDREFFGKWKTKRQAIAACEKHARNNPSKK